MIAASKPAADKARGQHFLVDPRVSRKIVDLFDLSGVSTIIEIGPGRGALTAELLKTHKRVVAVEVDRRMAAYLRRELPAELEIVEASILDVEPDDLVGKSSSTTKTILVGNLPYNLGGPILEWMFRSSSRWSQAVVMLQLEVARRLVAGPQSREFGPLAVACALHYEAHKRFLVRPGAFFPRPKVTSAVVELKPTASVPLTPDDPPEFMRLVHALFAYRRKNVRNNLKMSTGLPDAALKAILAAAGVDGGRRAEQLSWTDLEHIDRALRRAGYRH